MALKACKVLNRLVYWLIRSVYRSHSRREKGYGTLRYDYCRKHPSLKNVQMESSHTETREA